MPSMLIAFNGTRENGQFMGDQLCYLKTAYAMVENRPADCDKILLAMSPNNEMHFLWQKFIDVTPCEVVYDTFHPGDNPQRWAAWDKWRAERHIEGRPFKYYRELYLRIHGAQRQHAICGSERGLGRKNIYEYLLYGQEDLGDNYVGTDWFDDSLVYHPPLHPIRDVYISPHCKTQGNITFTFEYWAAVVRRLIDAGVSVTVGYPGPFCDDFIGNPLYHKHWGDHKQWMEQLCQHKIVACGNTGTGWLAAACGVPLFTMEPPNSVMADHRYRECGLRNIVEVMSVPDYEYCAQRLIEEVNRTIVLTTGCYDILHAGHIRHLERSKALGTRLIVALNDDASVARLKPGRPINPVSQRKTVLEALRCVDEVRIFDGDNAALLQAVKPQVLTNGYGYTLDTVVGRDIVEAYGGKVVVTCPKDAIDEPSTTKIVKRLKQSDIIEVCRLAERHSLNPFDKLRLLADQLLSVIHLQGDIADLGAYKGGTSLILRRLAPDKQLHLFDTWAGNPIDDPLCHHKKGEWPASLDECRALVGAAHYHQGVFPATATGDQYCFVYIDPDTYDAVRDAIAYFWPRLVPGGKLVFDDYGWAPCAGVKKAVDEALQVQVIGYTAIGVKR